MTTKKPRGSRMPPGRVRPGCAWPMPTALPCILTLHAAGWADLVLPFRQLRSGFPSALRPSAAASGARPQLSTTSRCVRARLAMDSREPRRRASPMWRLPFVGLTNKSSRINMHAEGLDRSEYLRQVSARFFRIVRTRRRCLFPKRLRALCMSHAAAFRASDETATPAHPFSGILQIGRRRKYRPASQAGSAGGPGGETRQVRCCVRVMDTGMGSPPFF